MTSLGCYTCGFVETVGNILLNCAEYQIVDGELRCPICLSPLHDVSPERERLPLAFPDDAPFVLDPLWYEGMAGYDLSLI